MQPLAGLLVFLLLLSFVNSCVGDNHEMVVVFKGGETVVPFEENNGSITMRKPRAFRIPAFVGGVFNDKEFLAVICDVRYDSYSDWSFIETVTKTSYGEYKRWSNAEIVLKNTRKSMTHSVVGDVTGVMKGNKIYVLASSWDESKMLWTRHDSNTGWNPLMVVGTVMNRSDSKGGDLFVKWDEGISLKSILPKKVNWASTSQFIGGKGNGVVTRDGTIIFPVQIANNRHQVAASIIYSTDGENWKMGGATPAGPTESSVVQWDDGKLILFTRYDYGYRKAYESDNMGKTWKESLLFSRVWGNKPERRGVGSQGSAITASVYGRDVLLFSHPLNKKEHYARDTLQLWLSDGQRIMCVGTISEDEKGESSGHSILVHIGNNLYNMHEINPYGNWINSKAALSEWDRVIALSPLPHFYETVKKTVHAWRQLDAWLKAKGVQTNVLVGFWGSSKADDLWTDMYNCVHANAKGGTRVQGGFRFNSAVGGGAELPVTSQGQNQVYIFTRYQYTLAATVKLHDISSGGSESVLGASKDDEGNAVIFGLGYTSDKKWYVYQSNGENIFSPILLVPEKEYHVALTFANGVASVYVDGVDIANGKLKSYYKSWVSHFYMGGKGIHSTKKGISCTVKNVMLFNRALNQQEISRLTQVSNKIQNEPPFVEIANIPDNHKSPSTTGTKGLPGNSMLVPSVKSKGTAVTDRQRFINEGVIDKNNDPSKHFHRDVIVEGWTKSTDSSAVSSSFVASMSLIFSIILLTCV